jgi:hypothetical protein
MTNQLGKILLFVTSYEKCDVSKRQLILKSVTLYVKIRKNNEQAFRTIIILNLVKLGLLN